MAEYGKKITEDLEICRFDGVSASMVYVGGLCDLFPVEMQWRKINYPDIGEELEFLCLSEIVQQIQEGVLITVIVGSPLHGEIYQYGNYGPEWWFIGETMGYA